MTVKTTPPTQNTDTSDNVSLHTAGSVTFYSGRSHRPFWLVLGLLNLRHSN